MTCGNHGALSTKKLALRAKSCIECMEIYLLVSSAPRMPIKPTKTHTDKSKYTRKSKHKGSNGPIPSRQNPYRLAS